jgi:hypothetical protein
MKAYSFYSCLCFLGLTLAALSLPAANLVDNPNFETVGANGVLVNLPGAPAPFESPAKFWFLHTSNNNAPVSSRMMPSDGPNAPRMIEVRCGGNEGGVYQKFNPSGNKNVRVTAYVKVLSGQVQLGVGVDGFTSQAISVGPTNKWEKLSFVTDGTKLNNWVWVYNQNPNGGLFYVDFVEIEPVCAPVVFTKNGSFSFVGPLGIATNHVGPIPPGGIASAAQDWKGHNSNAGSLINTNLLGSTGPDGGRMLLVRTLGNEGGVFQQFDPAGVKKVMVTAWVFVIKGQVQLGLGKDGFTSQAVMSTKVNQWEKLTIVSDGATLNNWVWVYNQAPSGGDFYIDFVEVKSICPPVISIAGLPFKN